MAFMKTAFPENIWQKVLAKTNGSCTYCGKILHADLYGKCQPIPCEDGAWEVDHWIPRSWFNDETKSHAFINLWPACCGCNDEKSDRVSGEVYVLERINNGLHVNSVVVDALVANATSKGSQ